MATHFGPMKMNAQLKIIFGKCWNAVDVDDDKIYEHHTCQIVIAIYIAVYRVLQKKTNGVV